VRRLKLETLMYLSSCSVMHWSLPLFFLFWLEPVCTVLWREYLHSIVPDLQFLGNVLHGIAFSSQNKNRLMSFGRKVFVSGHFEPVIEPTNADAPNRYSTSLKKDSFIAFLIRTQ
jgi:hypothetical protein